MITDTFNVINLTQKARQFKLSIFYGKDKQTNALHLANLFHTFQKNFQSSEKGAFEKIFPLANSSGVTPLSNKKFDPTRTRLSSTGSNNSIENTDKFQGLDDSVGFDGLLPKGDNKYYKNFDSYYQLKPTFNKNSSVTLPKIVSHNAPEQEQIQEKEEPLPTEEKQRSGKKMQRATSVVNTAS